MTLPEIPQNAKQYFWLLAMMLAFGAVTAAMNRLAGGTGQNVPPPPTIMVQPVVVGQSADGTLRAISIESPAKK